MHRAAHLARRAWAVLILSLFSSLAAVARPSPISHEPGPVSPSALLSIKKSTDPETPEGPAPLLATLVNLHTGDITALDDDGPDPARFSTLVEDRVTGARIDFDMRVVDLLRRLVRGGPPARIELVSGYRSPKLNETLRKKGHRVASHSQHSLGHALDFRIVGMTPAEMRKAIEHTGWKGGIGQYDKPTDQFVHADTGRDRRWRER